MQAVPSVIGTGTVVAAAAVGLVFGQPSQTPQSRPPSNKRKLTSEHETLPGLPASSRPGTSSCADVRPVAHASPSISASASSPASQHPLQPLSPSATNTTARPPRAPPATDSQTTPPKAASRRHSFIRNEWVSPPITENWRSSVSSNGSWIRRLSIRPLSQHGSSPRSSVGPDSPSLPLSYGSGAAVISPAASTPTHLPPNKLVKRSTATSASSQASQTVRRGQTPTLRRPATSHQRSATLQQVQGQEVPPLPAIPPKYSLDQQARPSLPSRSLDVYESRTEPHRWISFFHAKVVQATTTSGNSPRSSEGSPSHHQLTTRSIHIRKGSTPRAYLIDASMISTPITAIIMSSDESSPAAALAAAATTAPTPARRKTATTATVPTVPTVASEFPASAEESRGSPVGLPRQPSSNPEETPSKRTRRSISMHFSSPTNWISKSGSIRRQKRGLDNKSGGVRNVSAPAGTSSPIAAQADVKQDLGQLFTPPGLNNKRAVDMTLDVSALSQMRTRQRNSSSPLPPLTRLSSFNFDLYRVGTSTSASPSSRRQEHQLQASPIIASPSHQPFPVSPHSRDVSNERASTLAGSDLEVRAFMSGDDDDTDFKSDTMFDSLRTTGSARIRNVETPLESMFDESPPSTAGNSKTKRLSIQEILGRSWDGDTRIMEEDEGAPTPIRGSHSPSGERRYGTTDCLARDSFDYKGSADLSLASRDFGRLSLDDDDDYDWARDDENGLCNHLSPPSSSVNSRVASASFRMALASISGNASSELLQHEATSERPRSNVFDWSEPPTHERFDADGPSPRPKTVHGKQESDVRAGRSAHRKGPTAAHVRSQSVPVVPEPSESSKAGSKFRTWASGPKNVSENWEEDFEFDEGGLGDRGEGDTSTSRFSMIVPESIQATQPTVKAHSGQIRELSLLVNGLKRLCRLGRDLSLMEESSALWKEAENIIALASPDEDEDGAASDGTGSSDIDSSMTDQRYVDEGFDGRSLSREEDPFDVHELSMSKTAVVRERQIVRRRSVFSPEDDIFGCNWPPPDEDSKPARPQTPDRSREADAPNSAVIASVMEAMLQQRRSSSAPVKGSPTRPSNSKLFFDTNSLQELVKRANALFHSLSDIVRRAELITQSPVSTPKRERHLRHDGSPAFTRVFTDPASSPPRRIPKSHSNNSVLSRSSIDSRGSATNGLGQRMQLMIVN